jgi:hypothetical protein
MRPSSLRRKNLRKRMPAPVIHWQILLGFMLVFAPFAGWAVYINSEQIAAFIDADFS